MAEPGEGPGGPGPSFISTAKGPEAKKKIEYRAFFLSQGLDDQDPSFSEGLDLPLIIYINLFHSLFWSSATISLWPFSRAVDDHFYCLTM